MDRGRSLKIRQPASFKRCTRGGVSEVMKIHSLHPEAMEAHLDLYLEIMFGRGPSGRRWGHT